LSPGDYFVKINGMENSIEVATEFYKKWRDGDSTIEIMVAYANEIQKSERQINTFMLRDSEEKQMQIAARDEQIKLFKKEKVDIEKKYNELLRQLGHMKSAVVNLSDGIYNYLRTEEVSG